MKWIWGALGVTWLVIAVIVFSQVSRFNQITGDDLAALKESVDDNTRKYDMVWAEGFSDRNDIDNLIERMAMLNERVQPLEEKEALREALQDPPLIDVSGENIEVCADFLNVGMDILDNVEFQVCVRGPG